MGSTIIATASRVEQEASVENRPFQVEGDTAREQFDGRYFAGAGLGVASPGMMPMDHGTSSSHIF
jgi:hypothetical protein